MSTSRAARSSSSASRPKRRAHARGSRHRRRLGSVGRRSQPSTRMARWTKNNIGTATATPIQPSVTPRLTSAKPPNAATMLATSKQRTSNTFFALHGWISAGRATRPPGSSAAMDGLDDELGEAQAGGPRAPLTMEGSGRSSRSAVHHVERAGEVPAGAMAGTRRDERSRGAEARACLGRRVAPRGRAARSDGEPASRSTAR